MDGGRTDGHTLFCLFHFKTVCDCLIYNNHNLIYNFLDVIYFTVVY